MLTLLRMAVRRFAILQLPQLQVLQESVMGGEGSDAKTGEPIAKAAFQNKIADKGGGTNRCDLQRRSPLPLFQHLARAQRRVSLADHAVMLGSIANRVVQQIAGEHSDASVRV